MRIRSFRHYFVTLTLVTGFLMILIMHPAASAQGGTATLSATLSVTANAPYLGVLTTISTRGVEVSEVVPGSPAALAGFRVGDLITSVNGQALAPNQPLSSLIAPLSPGALITIIVTRADGWKALKATLGTKPNDALPPTPLLPATGGAFLGVGLIEQQDGIHIAQVVAGSPAAISGLQVNDLMISIDGQAITSVAQVQALLTSKTSGQTAVINVQRATQSLSITVTLGASSAALTAVPSNSTPTAGVSPISTLVAQPPPYDPGAPRVQLGVVYEVLTPALAATRQVSVQSGALIIEVQPNSPADLAAIKAGDVITEVDGDKVDAKHTLAVRMVAYSAGDTLTLTVVRGTQTLHVSVTLAARGTA